MDGYLGEVDVTDEYLFTRDSLALHFIEKYGGIGGEHHKAWLIDQIARIMWGTKPIVKVARWGNGKAEVRVNLDEPSERYNQWVREIEEGGFEYDYGIAP